MINLIVSVEGHAEEAFVNQMLVPHLAALDVFCVATRVEFSRQQGKTHRGGLIAWQKADRDIRLWLKQRNTRDVRVTTMYDLYKLPGDAPGRASAAKLADPFSKVHAIETAIQASVGDPRFLPYIQLHEFEAMVLVEAKHLGDFYPTHRRQAARLADLVARHPTPEHIDEGKDTAPSKRIIGEIPAYEYGKVAAAPIVLQNTGLPAIRQACPHFGAWLTCLERLDASMPLAWPTLVRPPL
ncbi:MAG: DUF4276 family protein [Phycisphaerales bacterium]|nr:DUF4276 family protein [Phycisphaerales bacterium]